MSNNTYRSVWAVIKDNLMTELYETQINHWNEMLYKMIQTVAAAGGIVIGEKVAINCAIQYNNQTWRCLPPKWVDTMPYPPYHFSFDPAYGDEQKMLSITQELDVIKRERYETDRFLCALNMYFPTKYQLREILGDTLYSTISAAANTLTESRDDILHTKTLDQFLEESQPLLTHMQERILVNLVMSDLVTPAERDKQ